MRDKSLHSQRTGDNCIKIEGRDRQDEDIMSSLDSPVMYAEPKGLMFHL